MRIVGVVLQIVFFLVLIFASLLVAGIISNRLPLNDPPGFGTRISTYLSTNVAETSADTVFPELKLRRYEAPPSLLFDVARRAVQGMKWEVTSMDDAKNEIHAVVTTKLWKYKDDVVIQIQPAQPSGSWLWVRSSSRVGKGDLGANTRHIMDLVRYVDETVPKQAIVSQ
jgi:uncharacterized protein (DUF1499 family)